MMPSMFNSENTSNTIYSDIEMFNSKGTVMSLKDGYLDFQFNSSNGDTIDVSTPLSKLTPAHEKFKLVLRCTESVSSAIDLTAQIANGVVYDPALKRLEAINGIDSAVFTKDDNSLRLKMSSGDTPIFFPCSSDITSLIELVAAYSSKPDKSHIQRPLVPGQLPDNNKFGVFNLDSDITISLGRHDSDTPYMCAVRREGEAIPMYTYFSDDIDDVVLRATYFYNAYHSIVLNLPPYGRNYFGFYVGPGRHILFECQSPESELLVDMDGAIAVLQPRSSKESTYAFTCHIISAIMMAEDRDMELRHTLKFVKDGIQDVNGNGPDWEIFKSQG